jgi:hypothetical protein
MYYVARVALQAITWTVVAQVRAFTAEVTLSVLLSSRSSLLLLHPNGKDGTCLCELHPTRIGLMNLSGLKLKLLGEVCDIFTMTMHSRMLFDLSKDRKEKNMGRGRREVTETLFLGGRAT